MSVNTYRFTIEKALGDNRAHWLAIDQNAAVQAFVEYLEKRREYLLRYQDSQGSFRDDCPNHLHVRNLTGARTDCDDLITELQTLLKQER